MKASNGGDRQLPAGTTCGPDAPEPQVDENARTAKFLFHSVLQTNLYSGFAASNGLMPDEDFEYDMAGVAPGAFAFRGETGSNRG
jgi:hypothetical protein